MAQDGRKETTESREVERKVTQVRKVGPRSPPIERATEKALVGELAGEIELVAARDRRDMSVFFKVPNNAVARISASLTLQNQDGNNLTTDMGTTISQSYQPLRTRRHC